MKWQHFGALAVLVAVVHLVASWLARHGFLAPRKNEWYNRAIARYRHPPQCRSQPPTNASTHWANSRA